MGKKPTKKGKKPLVVEEPEESFEVKPRKPSVTQTENVETVADYELKQIKSETLLEDVEGEFQIGLKPKPKLVEAKPETVEEEQEKEEQVTEKVSEENKMTVKRPTKKKNIEDTEEVEDSFRLKPLKKKTVVKEDVESDGTFKLKKTETEPKQDIEEEFQIGLKPVPKPIVSTSKDVEEDVKVGLKSKSKTRNQWKMKLL